MTAQLPIEVLTDGDALRFDVRDLWVELDAAATDYAALRTAANLIPWDDETRVWDEKGDHAEWELGKCTLLGPLAVKAPSWSTTRMPWAEGDRRGEVLYFARAGAVPWWPTPSQVDQAWIRHHPEEYETQVRKDSPHHQVHARG